ncbi:MAG: hypothetical protein GF383_14200 [Candidatus Lokiarchaeota archaeon]|nr:hypothetical protein [Candidatus Lokiarchaeota archaeon]MBD3342509.1 hypothetical protein [Candidatus Lokiarchaeota archaeon]
MTKDEIAILMYIKNLLSDLVYMNGVIATELTKITENLAALRHGEDFLERSPCIEEHNRLNSSILDVVKRHFKNEQFNATLEKHVLKHLEGLEK